MVYLSHLINGMVDNQMSNEVIQELLGNPKSRIEAITDPEAKAIINIL